MTGGGAADGGSSRRRAGSMRPRREINEPRISHFQFTDRYRIQPKELVDYFVNHETNKPHDGGRLERLAAVHPTPGPRLPALRMRNPSFRRPLPPSPPMASRSPASPAPPPFRDPSRQGFQVTSRPTPTGDTPQAPTDQAALC